MMQFTFSQFGLTRHTRGEKKKMEDVNQLKRRVYLRSTDIMMKQTKKQMHFDSVYFRKVRRNFSLE